MSLNSSSLADALATIFEGRDGHPGSATEAGELWAKVYGDYAAGATAGPTAPLGPSTLVAQTTLAKSLAAAFEAAQAAGPAALLPALGVALAGFWLAPPVAFVSPTIAGVVTVAVPGGLPAELGQAFAAGVDGGNAAGQGESIAAAFDAFTKTVMVVNTPFAPPGPPSPPVALS